jgi:GT2 family glycosyltransferase
LESWGDFDFCRRAAGAGFRLRYAPEAFVRHPARANVRDLLKKNSRVARGFVVFGYERRTKTLRSNLGWVYVLTRPRLRDWYHTLVGGRGSEILAWSQRPAVLALQILIRYHFAWAHLRAILRSQGAGAGKDRGAGLTQVASGPHQL